MCYIYQDQHIGSGFLIFLPWDTGDMCPCVQTPWFSLSFVLV